MESLRIDKNKLHQMQGTDGENKEKAETKFTFTFSYKDLVDWLDFYFLPYDFSPTMEGRQWCAGEWNKGQWRRWDLEDIKEIAKDMINFFNTNTQEYEEQLKKEWIE